MTPHRGHREIPSNDFKRYLDKYYGANTVGPSELDVWRAMSEKPDVSYTRPELKKAGMRHREIDKLLAEFGPPGFRTVNIPKATPYVGGTVTLTRTSPVPLKRRMSWRARKNQLPEPVTGQRRFFRTWVRAVKI